MCLIFKNRSKPFKRLIGASIGHFGWITNKESLHQLYKLFLLRKSEIKRLTSNSLINAHDVISDRLEVAIDQNNSNTPLPGSIIRRGDEAFILLTVVNRFEGIRHLIKTLEDVTQKVDGGIQLHLRVLSLHSGGADGNVNALGADRVVPGHHRHVNIYEIRRRRLKK